MWKWKNKILSLKSTLIGRLQGKSLGFNLESHAHRRKESRKKIAVEHSKQLISLRNTFSVPTVEKISNHYQNFNRILSLSRPFIN